MAVRMAVREELSLLSGLIICEIVNSVGQGNFTFVRKKSGNFKHLWLWQPCNKLHTTTDDSKRTFSPA